MKKIILTTVTLLIAFGSVVNAGNKTKKADCCNGGSRCSSTSACCKGK